MKILIKILLLLLIILSFCECRKGDGKSSVPVNPITPKTKYNKIKHVSFYIENSGSMFGYVNGTTEFVNAVNDLAQFPNLVSSDTPFYYYLISGKKDYNIAKDSLTIYPLGEDPAILRSLLTKKGFEKPSSNFSDLKNMFEIALKKANKDSISILISDGIYDVGGSTNPLSALDTEGNLTRTKFIQRLKIDDIETLLIKLDSKFIGDYIPANVTDQLGKSERIDQKRPYYIWIFGNFDLLNTYFPEIKLKELTGYIDLARFRKVSNNIPDYEAISYKNFGFTKDIKNSKTFELYHNVTKLNQFTIAVDFSNLNLPDSYLSNKNNYEYSPNYFIDKITPIGINVDTNLKPYIESLKFKPTHILTIVSKTNQPEIGDVKITLNNILPDWIKLTNTNNDYPFDNNTSQTFGFSTLIKGISEAYIEVSNPKYLAQFNITIKN